MLNAILIKKNRDHKLWLRKIISRNKRKTRNRALQGVTIEQKLEQRKREKIRTLNQRCKKLTAPNNFSLLENTEEVLAFINHIDECFAKRKSILINMEYVQHIAYGAIIVLLSKLVQFKTKKIYVNGIFPKNNEAKRILKESGFIDYLYKEDIRDNNEYFIDKKICTHANKIADAQLSAEIIRNVSKTLWDEERRCIGVQRVFLELMQNTNNHAADRPGEKHWWTSFVHVKSDTENKICFSFIDYGVGIFNSLTNKKTGKFLGITDKIKEIFGEKNNAELLRMLLRGEVHDIVNKTKTHKPYRGKGIPGIYNAVKKNDIANLQIISNDAYANVAIDEYKCLNNQLLGTYVEWELNDNNNNI